MKLSVHTQGNSFFIDWESGWQVVLKGKKDIKEISMASAGAVYSVSVQELFSIYQKTSDNKIYMYAKKQDRPNEPYEEIYIDRDSNVFVENTLWLDYQGQRCTLYISLDNKIRFLWNSPPSVKSYYSQHKLKALSSEENLLRFHLNIQTQYMPIDSATLLFKNRKNGNKVILPGSSVQSISKDSRHYLNDVHFAFPVTEILNLVQSESFEKYDLNILDVSFVPSFPYTQVNFGKSDGIRISFTEGANNDEYWTTYSEKYKLLFRAYPTKYHQKLSFRLTYVSNDSYHYYLQMKEQDIQPAPVDRPGKPIILVTEYPTKAQDTGFAFFRFLKEKHADDCEAYYVVSRISKDLDNLAPYQDSIIWYRSPEHFRIISRVNVLAHSHIPVYGFPLISNFMSRFQNGIFKVFLHHGIICARNIKIYDVPNFTDLTILSSDREKKLMLKDFNYYREDQLVVTGLSRFDELLEKGGLVNRIKSRKNLLIMPTWRLETQHMTHDKFKQTKYYSVFQSLINHPILRRLSQKKKLRISFYLHTNAQQFTDLFSSDFVHIIHEGEVRVQKLIQDNGIMITDYSSVGLDFALLKRRVIFYQFEPLSEAREGYQALCPGDIVQNEKALIRKVLWACKNNGIKFKYAKKLRRNLFKYMDRNSCNRIYFEIINRLTAKSNPPA